MRLRGAALLTALVLVATAGCTSGAKDRPTAVYPAGKRVEAPALRGELLQGGSFDLGGHRGEVVVVNFWASWCAPCRSEIGELTASYEAMKDDRVSFLGINTHDERDPARAFLTAHAHPYPSIFDPPGEWAVRFKVPPNTVPATLIIDRKGRVAAVYRKALVREELTPAIRLVAGEKP